MNQTNASARISPVLRLAEVQRMTGISRATIYRKIQEGRFPRQRRIGANSVGWLEHEIGEWIASLPQVHT